MWYFHSRCFIHISIYFRQIHMTTYSPSFHARLYPSHECVVMMMLMTLGSPSGRMGAKLNKQKAKSTSSSTAAEHTATAAAAAAAGPGAAAAGSFQYSFTSTLQPGASIPMGQGGTRPPQYLDWGDIITNVPLNISGVISATFYPCNIFLISWKSSQGFLRVFSEKKTFFSTGCNILRIKSKKRQITFCQGL